MLVEDGERILLASDFHLGLEYELAKMGVSIPYQTDRILAELLSVVREGRPDRLILLGDVKHGVPITSFMERREISRFFESLSAEVKVIDVARGNHDGNLQQLVPEGVTIHPSGGFTVGEGSSIAIVHGHAWPYPRLMSADLIVMGHNHPTVLLKTPLGVRVSQRVWVRGRCDRPTLAKAFLRQAGLAVEGDPVEAFEAQFGVRMGPAEMVLMPAFNDLLGGLPVNSDAPKSLLGPLLRTGAINVDGFEVYLLDSTYLGEVSFLRSLT
jgi:hypothetical protein